MLAGPGGQCARRISWASVSKRGPAAAGSRRGTLAHSKRRKRRKRSMRTRRDRQRKAEKRQRGPAETARRLGSGQQAAETMPSASVKYGGPLLTPRRLAQVEKRFSPLGRGPSELKNCLGNGRCRKGSWQAKSASRSQAAVGIGMGSDRWLRWRFMCRLQHRPAGHAQRPADKSGAGSAKTESKLASHWWPGPGARSPEYAVSAALGWAWPWRMPGLCSCGAAPAQKCALRRGSSGPAASTYRISRSPCEAPPAGGARSPLPPHGLTVPAASFGPESGPCLFAAVALFARQLVQPCHPRPFRSHGLRRVAPLLRDSARPAKPSSDLSGFAQQRPPWMAGPRHSGQP